MTPGARGRSYYYGIDLVRFAAALMVVCFHLGYATARPASRSYLLSKGELQLSYGDLFYWGEIGVEIFFVISGFVIANSANNSTPFRFLRSRAERLYPAVWLCAPISLLIWLTNDPANTATHLGSFAHTITLFPLGTWVDAPYWTLAHEVVFYGLVFLLILTGNFRHLALFAIIVTAVSAAFRAALVADTRLGFDVPGLALFNDHSGQLLLTKFGSFFALGMFMWMHRHARLGRAGYAAAAIAFAVCLVHTTDAGRPEAIVPTLVWLVGLAAVLAATYHEAKDDGRSRRFRLLRDIGLATYPLYLIHFALGVWTMRELVRAGASVDVAFFGSVFLLSVAAYGIAKYAEPLGRRAIRALFDRLDAAAKPRLDVYRLLHRPGGALTSPTG